MPADRSRSTSRPVRRALLVALAALAAAFPAWAQPLPEEATQALREGQQAAALALATYDDHFPDRPLWEQAIDAGERAARLAPDRSEPQRFLAQVYSLTGWYIRAWEAWEAYRRLGGTMDAPARSHLLEVASWLAYNAHANARFEDAVRYFRVVLELSPDDTPALERLAVSLLETGREDEAVPLLERLAAENDGYAELLARAEDQRRFGRAAVEAYRAGLERYRAGDVAAALPLFEEAVEAAPPGAGYADALAMAGRSALELGRPGPAADYLQQARALGANDPSTLAALQRAETLDRWGAEAYAELERGVERYRAGDRAGAETAFRAALAVNGNFADAWAWLGRLAFEAEDFQAALDHYRRATRLAPENSDYRFFLSEVERLYEAEIAARAQTEAEARAAAEEEARAEAVREAEELAAEEEAAAQAAREAAAQEAAAEAAAADAARAEATAAQAEAAATEPQALAAPAPEPVAAPAETPAPPAPQPTPAAAVATGGPPLVLLDRTLRHDTVDRGGSGAFSFFPAAEPLATNLVEPVNYAGGRLYQRLEVIAKPSDEDVRYQICLVTNDAISVKPSCSDGTRLVFDDPGVYESVQELPTFSGYGQVSWQTGLQSVILVVQNGEGTPIDNRYAASLATGERFELERFYPMEVRYTAMIVPRGSDFPGWP